MIVVNGKVHVRQVQEINLTSSEMSIHPTKEHNTWWSPKSYTGRASERTNEMIDSKLSRWGKRAINNYKSRDLTLNFNLLRLPFRLYSVVYSVASVERRRSIADDFAGENRVRFPINSLLRHERTRDKLVIVSKRDAWLSYPWEIKRLWSLIVRQHV